MQAENMPPPAAPATVAVRVRADDAAPSQGSWQTVALTNGSGTLGATGTMIEVEVQLATDDRNAVPNVDALVLTFEKP